MRAITFVTCPQTRARSSGFPNAAGSSVSIPASLSTRDAVGHAFTSCSSTRCEHVQSLARLGNPVGDHAGARARSPHHLTERRALDIVQRKGLGMGGRQLLQQRGKIPSPMQLPPKHIRRCVCPLPPRLLFRRLSCVSPASQHHLRQEPRFEGATIARLSQRSRNLLEYLFDLLVRRFRIAEEAGGDV